jgi:Mn-containing catalase
MSKTGAYKTTLVQVIYREIYHHTPYRNGEEEAEEQAQDENLNPIKDSDITYRETIYNWDDLKYKETTHTEFQGIEEDE